MNIDSEVPGQNSSPLIDYQDNCDAKIRRVHEVLQTPVNSDPQDMFGTDRKRHRQRHNPELFTKVEQEREGNGGHVRRKQTINNFTDATTCIPRLPAARPRVNPLK